MKLIEQGVLTSWRRQKEELVRTKKHIDQERDTHCLEAVGRGTCQDTERNRPIGGTHVLETAEEGTCQDIERNQPSEGTYALETAEGETCQDTERNRSSEEHSQTGDGRGRDLSEHGKISTERGTLTF